MVNNPFPDFAGFFFFTLKDPLIRDHKSVFGFPKNRTLISLHTGSSLGYQELLVLSRQQVKLLLNSNH